MFKTLFYTSIIILLTLTNVASSEEVIDSICAIVDDDIILESEIRYGVSTYLLENGIRYPADEQVQELRQQVINAYIDQKILIAKALEETLSVEERVVNKQLDAKMEELTRQVGSKEKLVEYFGRPLRQIKRDMKKGVEEGMLIDMLKQQQLTGIHVRRDEVIDFYRRHTDQMPEMPEQVDLAHILLIIEPSEKAREEALQRVENVLDLLHEGLDFDSLAREYSEDPSASSGGYLGFTDRGDLVPEYEEIAYELEPGMISPIVETRYGFHLIKLVERQGERISTQHILIKLEPNESDRQRVLQLTQTLRADIKQGTDFGELARKYSADEETASKGGKLDRMSASDLPEEFSKAINGLDPGDVSEPVETLFGYHIIKLIDRIPARKISLDRDWQTIEQFAMVEKRESEFQKWLQSLKTDHYIWPEGQ